MIFLQRYFSPEDVATFHQSKIGINSFPLKLLAVKQVNYKAISAVQLADVLVGAAIEAANSL